jgi:hypothetical protein
VRLQVWGVVSMSRGYKSNILIHVAVLKMLKLPRDVAIGYSLRVFMK